MAITEIKTVTMEIEQAKEEHKKYVALAKENADQHIIDMKRALWQLSRGNELIDIYQTFKSISLMDDMPRMAIVRADAELCYFQKRSNGAGCFGHKRITGGIHSYRVGKVALPTGTFEWKNKWVRKEENKWTSGSRKVYQATTVPPRIPAEVYPKHKLSNYYLMWEVEKGGWLPDPMPPEDPFLLKRVTNNLFVPLAAWDLTPLEKSILSGLSGPER
jgi:hypothetical protein